METKDIIQNNMEVFTRKADESAKDYAYRTVKDNIIALNLEPGRMISVQEIAEEIGVSRTPSREALLELSKQGLVEIIPQRGSMISMIDYDIIEEARFLRLIVEIAVSELACDMRTQKDLEKLEEYVLLQEFYLERNSSHKLLQVDNAFHRKLYKIANKEMILKIVEDTTVHFDRLRRLSYNTIKDTKVIEDHKELIEAIRDRDKECAKESVTRHLSRYKMDADLIKSKYPHYIL